jgi:hypothetical protein
MVFPLKFEFFWLSSGLGGRLSLTLINQREWRIQIMSGVIVIVGVNGDDYQLILKNNYKVFSVTSDFLNQIHATQKLFRPWTQDEYKISDCDIKDKTVVHIRPVLWPAYRSATPPLTIHNPRGWFKKIFIFVTILKLLKFLVGFYKFIKNPGNSWNS